MRIGDDLNGGYEATTVKLETDRKGFDEAVYFFKKHSEIEREYAKKLLALLDHAAVARDKVKKHKSVAQPVESTEASTLAVGWDTMVQKMKDIANAHLTFGEEIATLALDPLSEFSKNNQKVVDGKVKDGGKATDELRNAQAQHTKAQKACEKLKQEIEGMKAKLANPAGAQATKLAMDLQNMTKKVPPTEATYEQCAQKLNQTRLDYYTSRMPQLLNEIEDIENNRVETMKSSFIAYVDAASKIAPVVSDSCASATDACSAIDCQADIDSFINTHLSEQLVVEEVPEKFDINPKKEGLTAEQMKALASQYQHGGDVSAPPAPAAAPAAPQAPAKASVVCKARAKFEYTGQDANELSFAEGDIIDIVQQYDDGWWEGIKDGRQGLVPSSFVEEI